MDLPTSEAAQWSLMEWAAVLIFTALSTIIAWAGTTHFTVRRLDRDVSDLKADMKEVATKDDINGVRADLRLILERLLGRPAHHSTEE